MKAAALFSVLLSSALAAPASPAQPASLEPRTFRLWKALTTCPANAVQTDGKLPKNSISTSALVPISAKNPDTTYPSSDWATVTPNDKCTIFNLELDSNAVQGKICNLIFDFPNVLQAPGLFIFNGSGKFTFTGYDINAGAVPGETTYNKQPRPGPSPPSPPATLTPGNSYVVNGAPCGIPPGIGKVTVSGSLCSEDSTLMYKQSDVICPLGFYVVLTDDPKAGKVAPH